MRVETEPTTQGCTTEKSLDTGQITIGTGHTSLNSIVGLRRNLIIIL